jgi:hypothetical protein
VFLENEAGRKFLFCVFDVGQWTVHYANVEALALKPFLHPIDRADPAIVRMQEGAGVVGSSDIL